MLLALLAACDGGPEDLPPPPELPAPRCLDHAYLPSEGMGELLFATRDDVLSLEPDELLALLAIVDLDALGPLTYGVDAWKIRYTTQDRGEPAEATALAVIPRVPAGEPLPIVVWLHPTAGGNDLCAPSGLGVYGGSFPLAFAARMGVAVIAPDYLGLASVGPASPHLHPYVVPEPTALSSLDAVKALLDLPRQKSLDAVLDRSRIAYWGISQGGHAALWADRYQPYYTPDLPPTAVVSVIPPTDLGALFTHSTEAFSDATEAVPTVLSAHADWYGADLGDLLLPEVVDEATQAMSFGCNVLDATEDRVDTVEAMFTPSALAGDVPPDWACIFDDNAIAQAMPRLGDAPVLVVLGELDELAYAPIARADATTLCDQGMEIELVECLGRDHEDAAIATLFRQEAWVQDRFAGVSMGPTCAFPPPEDCGPLPNE